MKDQNVLNILMKSKKMDALITVDKCLCDVMIDLGQIVLIDQTLLVLTSFFARCYVYIYDHEMIEYHVEKKKNQNV